MNVLVTGATGGLGRNLCPMLLDHGYRVSGIGRSTEIGAVLQKSGTEFIPCDIRTTDLSQRLPKGVDVVIHCAALSAPWGPYNEFFSTNVLGTRNILQWAIETGVGRFIHVSTPALYCDGNDRHFLNESAPLPARFINHYAHTKYLAEQEVENAGKRGLPVVTIRPRGIFGPHDTAIMPRLLRILERGWFPLIDGGGACLDVTCVQNVVEALLQLIVADDTVTGKKYNITNDEPLSIKELIVRVMNFLSLEARLVSIPSARLMRLAVVMEVIRKLSFLQGEPRLTKYGVVLCSILSGTERRCNTHL